MKPSKVKDRWRNVIQFIMASLAQEEDEPSVKIQEQINMEMYDWLMGNYQLSKKRRKGTIFDFNKSKTP